jgi:Flp pilus assembly pilin Flp
MRDLILKAYIRFRHNDEGVTLVEYGVAVALAVFVGTGALALLGADITGAMGAAGAVMP